MTVKQFRRWVRVVAAVVLLALVGYVVYVAIGVYYFEAVRLRPVVEAMPPPPAAVGGTDADALSVVFPNGEWVVGVVTNSHAAGTASRLGGGVVVLKDSRGRMRCFLGHVCGGGNIGQGGPGIDSLDALDVHLAERFTEKAWL